MSDTYFLGANTPAGFRSEYEVLQADPRIRRLLILKGGPGCGKSTLMKALAARAEGLGLAVERILCSSDPDSLDGVVVSEVGLALVDGTAPHVVEPKLCGCGANYLNLGQFYREALLGPLGPAIQAAKAANAACYGPVYGCLGASGALAKAGRELIGREAADRVTRGALERLLPEAPEPGQRPGQLRRRYLSGVTPKGLMVLSPRAEGLWTLRDGYSIGGPLLRALARTWQLAGEDVILAMDPLDPEAPLGVLVPGRGLGWLRQHPAFPAWEGALMSLDLDKALQAELAPGLPARLEELAALEQGLLEAAVGWLARAKAHHDLLEELYRPTVDFEAVTRQAETLARELLAEV